MASAINLMEIIQSCNGYYDLIRIIVSTFIIKLLIKIISARLLAADDKQLSDLVTPASYPLALYF